MSLTVKIDEEGKERLEKLQAKLQLTYDIRIDQFRLLRALVYFGEERIEDFLSFLQGTPITDPEIKTLMSKVARPYSYHYSEKTDESFDSFIITYH